ncbi:hypothetical protein [Streptomyces sp. NPDC001985]|uniref:hypothetical protein n=1 Tax=Streptomyces sp. NPDC001985 TaxID=3154406 RepID=UPI00331EE552
MTAPPREGPGVTDLAGPDGPEVVRPVLARELPEPAARIGGFLTVLDTTGARATAEDMLTTRHAHALTALDSVPYPVSAAGALWHIATRAVGRTS